MTTVDQVLKVDRECRRQGLTDNDDMFSLSELNYNKGWDFSLPTLDYDDNERNSHRIKQYTPVEFNYFIFCYR